jgi:hypothetical protein
MRIRTDGKYEYREDIIGWLADDLDENRTNALVDAAEHTRADIEVMERLSRWIAEQSARGELSRQQRRELVEIFDHPDRVVRPVVDLGVDYAVEFATSSGHSGEERHAHYSDSGLDED